MKLINYKTLVFDCDGVILDSNKVKTHAFYKAALCYGESAANQLVSYHVANGGISRYKKFDWFLQNIVNDSDPSGLDELLNRYAAEVRHGLLHCNIAKGLLDLRTKTAQTNWLIVSGGDQQELREIFAYRKIDVLFDGGIFGSPDSKEMILSRELANYNIVKPALFIGDSQYDFLCAANAGLDFCFMSGWTEFVNWREFCAEHNIKTLSSLFDLLE